MLDSFSNILLIECTLEPRDFARVCFKLDGSRLDNCEVDLKSDPDIIKTEGVYSLQYMPVKCNPNNWRFFIRGDVFGGNQLSGYRLKNYEEFEELCKTDDRLKWIKENTYISKRLFEIAEKNKVMRIPFSINIEKYLEKLGTDRFRNDKNEYMAVMSYVNSNSRVKRCIHKWK